MKIGFELGGGASATWRAEAGDAAGMARLAMLKESSGMDELSDDGSAGCRIVGGAELAREGGGSFGLPGHGMRIAFGGGDGPVRVAFREPTDPSQTEVYRWRGVRQMLFAGLVPHMLRGECFMVHGALLERDGRAVLVCGPSGIGKSTTAGRMAKRFRILADDCMALYRDGGRWTARPLPTWSVYLFGKSALTSCDVRSAFPVERFFILGRGDARYTGLVPREALIGVANSFTDMVEWHTQRYPEPLRRRLTGAALDAAAELTHTLPGGALQLTLECDIFQVLPE